MIIVHYGEESQLMSCMKSLATSSEVLLQLQVIYHGPSKKPSDLLLSFSRSLEKEPAILNVDLHVPKVNKGFAAGLNFGVEFALKNQRVDYFFFMNPDVWLEGEMLKFLVDQIQGNPKAFAAGPVLVEVASDIEFETLGEFQELEIDQGRDLRVWNAGSEINWPDGNGTSWANGEPLSPYLKTHPSPQEVGYLAGCAILMPVSVAKEIFPLSEDYFLYYEDAELGELIRQAGGKSLVFPHPQHLAYHRSGSSTSEKPEARRYYQTRSRIVFSKRWAPKGWKPKFKRWMFSLKRWLGGGSGREGVLHAYTKKLHYWDSW